MGFLGGSRLKRYLKKGRLAFLFALAAILLAGCMPSGGTSNPGWTVVAHEDGLVYTVLSTGRVLALDAEKGGSEVWRYPVGEAAGGIGCATTRSGDDGGEEPLDAVYGVPAITEELVLVSSFDGRLLA